MTMTSRNPIAAAACLCLLLTGGCAHTATVPVVAPPSPTTADMPAADTIPYPQLTEQEQIDQLGLQLSQLENEVASLHLRLSQLERLVPHAKSSVSSKKSTSKTYTTQRLSDSKLKENFLNNHSPAISQADPVVLNEIRLYNQALKYYRQNKFTAAATILKGADGGNGSETARRNMYLLLQTQQHLGNCESVIEIGGRYANRFKGSLQAPEALYSIAQCQYQMQQKDIARNTWRKLIQTYPNSNAAKRAAIRLKSR